MSISRGTETAESRTAQHRPSAKLKLKTKRIATLSTVDSNRDANVLSLSSAPPAAHLHPLSAVYLHNGLYLATIRARPCSIIDFASFHGQERGPRARKTAQERAAFRVGIAATSADDGRLFEFPFPRPRGRGFDRESNQRYTHKK